MLDSHCQHVEKYQNENCYFESGNIVVVVYKMRCRRVVVLYTFFRNKGTKEREKKKEEEKADKERKVYKLKFITCVNSIDRKTLRGFDSSDALSLFAAFYGRVFSWQCSSVFDFRSKTFLAPHLRTENRDKQDENRARGRKCFSVR